MQVSLKEFHRQVSLLFDPGLPTADERHKLLETLDPYPEIPPSLLHSGHLASYAAMTGMIEPFDLGALQKPATYLVPLEGLVRYRDSKGEFQRFYLSSDPTVRNIQLDVRSELILEQNSLCYVTLKPTFRMPAYIAGRFNLLIRDVYRGLLVGTGPLVDPGFVGRLSIPLHNFTSNEYPLIAGQGFVYFEFTKLSWTNGDQPPPTETWLKLPIAVQPPFPGSKNARQTIDDYLVPATGGLPAENAVGAEIRRLSGTSEEIARTTETIARRTQFFTVAGLAGIVGLLFTGWQVYLGAQQVVQAARADVANAMGKTADLLQRSKLEFDAALEALQKRTVTPEQVNALQSQLDQTREAIRNLESRVPSAKGTPSTPPMH
jgi:deoxycytidine triphosphate deaminase